MKKEAYFTTTIQQDIVFQYSGYQECEPDFIQNPHTRSEFLIHYIHRGSGYYICDTATYKLNQGDLFLISPCTLVSYGTDKENPFVFSWFAFTGKKAGDFIANMGFSDDRPVRKLHSRHDISEPVKILTDLIDSSAPIHDFTILQMLFFILSHIADSYHLSNHYVKEQKDIILEHVNRAKSYIKFNYMNKISVQDVVNHVRLERSYFSKIFRKTTGITVQKYILEKRLEQSRILLETTDYSIKEISSYVGFADEYYFSRAFSQTNGKPPSLYREAFRKG